MSFKPTPQQEQAIKTIDRHVAVTAGAGSGKTRVLVERYLNLLAHGVPVQRIAAITFTKKAAQEMKDRLCQIRPELIAQLEQAQISTIHSLCQRIIQEHPLEAAVDPRFRVGEEWETQALLIQTIGDLVDSAQHPEELGTALEVVELVRDVYEQMLRQGDLNFRQAVEPIEAEFSVVFFRARMEAFLELTPDTKPQTAIMEELRAEWPALSASLEFPQAELQLEALKILGSQIGRLRGNFAAQAADIKREIEQACLCIEHTRGVEIMAWLGKLLEDVHSNFSANKRKLGILDYNDLEHLAYRLLQSPAVRANYDFAHLMVDEFQDTNPLQKKIVDSIVAGGALLFVVGDPKQSIYRFRGADVGVFVRTKKEIEAGGKNIFLAENFRSRPELIEFANSLFPHIMEGDQISFEASAHTKERAGRPCVTLLRIEADDLTLNDAREVEAQQIALKIRELVDQGRYNYRDISVLFRTMTNVHLYEQALQEAGVPYVNLSGRGFYSRQEIQDVLNYFRWLQDRGDQVARLAVLRSPFYLISDQGLCWLRRDRPDMLSAEEREAYDRSGADYNHLSEMAGSKPAPEVITAMLKRTEYMSKIWRLPFGPQKRANMEKLLKLSWDLFARDVFSVPEQLRYIDLMSRDSKGEGEALLDAEHANVVILRTVHGAKGLEFPVGFLADTCGGLTRSARGQVLYHPDFGLRRQGMEGFEELKAREVQEELSEAKRLLYVAFTRAEEEIFWCVLHGKIPKVSWWRWLEAVIDQLPSELYTQAAGDLSPPETKSRREKPMQLEVTRYGPLPPQHEGVTFSVTSLMHYVRCPRCFYLRYILGVPERGSSVLAASKQTGSGISAVQRGNIVHRVCEQITNPAHLAELIDYAAAMEGIELDIAQKSLIKRIMEPYLASEFFRRLTEGQSQWQIYREKDFFLPAGRFLLNGLVDQVFVAKKGLEVVDFKSNWIRPEQVREAGDSYLVQLRLYAWAMARQFGVPVRRSQAYFLIPNEIYSLDKAFLDVEKTEAWIGKICGEIIKNAALGGEAFPCAEGCSNCTSGAEPADPLPFGKEREDESAWAEEE